MPVFWVIFNRREQSGKQGGKEAWGELAKVSPQKSANVETDGAFSGQLEDACLIKIEGASLTTSQQASEAAKTAYPGLATGRPCVVANANFKEVP